MNTENSSIKIPWMVVTVFLGLSLVICLAGVVFYRSGEAEIKRNIENNLTAIADLKVNLIENWRQERIANASAIRDNQLISARIYQWLNAPNDPAFAGSLLIWMSTLQRESGYESVLLLDPAGKPRLGTRTDSFAESGDRQSLQIALDSKKVVFSDLYRARSGGSIYLDLYAPLILEDLRESRVVGIMVLRIDPYKFLFPLIQSWPTTSRSAETLLVRREGNRILFLNELRHRKGSAFVFSSPLSESSAAGAALKSKGVTEGMDYRGVPVLAAFCPVPNTPWGMVAKVDTDEVYAPIRERARITFSMVLLLMAVAGTCVSIGWKHQATLFYRRQLEVERERKELAERAAESFSRLAAIVESSGDGIISTSLDGKIMSWNPGAARMTGYRSEEVLQKPITSLFPPDQAGPWAGVLDSLKDGDSLHDFETLLRAKDGPARQVALTVSPIRDDSGRLGGFSTIIRDISERKRAEAERGRLLDLEREARRQAEEANRMKDEFLATVSHELRTPLNPILGWAFNLRAGAVEPELLQEGLEAIERNARVQSRLVEDLLDVSRIVTGKLNMSIQPVDLRLVTDAAIENVRLAAQAKRIELIVHVDPNIPNVMGDPGRLQQILWNLLTNALKFTAEGGRIEVRLREDGSHVEASVVDNGEGIPADFLPHVFDQFRQADSSVTRKHGGLGLGLSIVRHLIELHGGTIRAESAGIGSGATFAFRLPVA